jgi:hypothetical protein
MTTKRTNAARVAAHKARGKYLCCTISPEAAEQLAAIQRGFGGARRCPQRKAIEMAIAGLADLLRQTDAIMREGSP